MFLVLFNLIKGKGHMAAFCESIGMLGGTLEYHGYTENFNFEYC